jgi:hypothetical protein
VMVQITLPTQQEWIRHARTYYDSFSSSTGEKVIAIIDNHGYVLAPVPVAPVHTADMVLLPEGLKALKKVAKEVGLDLRGAFSTSMAVLIPAPTAIRSVIGVGHNWEKWEEGRMIDDLRKRHKE